MNRTIEIDKKYYPSFARMFSPVVMEGLIHNGTSGYLTEVFRNSGLSNEIDSNTTLSSFFEWLHRYLLKSYRNEYIYKNAIANKILLGKHSLNTSHMLTELRVANCKADVVILNGTSTVYEIKSEYDSIDRLHNQISSYTEVFDRINVITSNSQLAKIKSVLDSRIGLMVLTPQNTIKTVREAESGKNKVIPEIIFNSLRKSEYLSIIKRLFDYIPDVPNTQIYTECKKLFCTLSPIVAHDEMVKILCQRGKSKVLKKFVEDIPDSLKAYALNTKLNKKSSDRLLELLKDNISSIMVPAI
jgi:hypothetical protein